ncbi:hypothetical protein DPMN_191117 [Dreissena polymorpha]|uniref:Uncharacterized protein n=1 Tax=Dreissena polymorpha TaxID=45954 RepID=A0A9D3XWZ9_DREPO|nr:hypothetical protein DPMN_191117 [Dreissena polymorpha]
MNILTKFHEDRKINVASRVLTRFYNSHFYKEKCPAPWQPILDNNVASRVFTTKNAPPFGSHTKLLTKFMKEWTINVASRTYKNKLPRPLGGHFHDDKANILTSKVFTRKFFYCHRPWRPCFSTDRNPIFNSTKHII